MPPKKSSKKSAPASSSSVSPQTSQALLSLVRLLESHSQSQAQAPVPTEQTYASAVEQLSSQTAELEKEIANLCSAQQASSRRQTDANAASFPSSAELANLTAWLRAEAPECLIDSHWEFQAGVSAAEGTGVRATTDLQQDQLFMSIPRSVMLTTDGVASSSPIGRYLASDPLCAKIPSLLLVCGLLYERALGSASYWAAYIQCLPRQVDLPMAWSVSEVRSNLQTSPTVYDVLMLQRSTVRQYVHLHAVLAKGGFLSGANAIDFTWSDFVWAMSVVMSRQNRIPPPSGTGEASIALIPGWDFCNHRGHGAVATFYVPESRASQSLTMESVKRGEPIYLFYGSRSNAKLMTYAGFVDVEHQHDDMEFVLRLDGRAASDATVADVDPLEKIKQMLLKKAHMGASFGVKLPLPESAGTVDKQTTAASAADEPESIAAAQEARQQARLQWNALLHFLRVAALRTKEHAALALKHKPAFGNPLSPTFHFLPTLYEEHDRDAYAILHAALTATLRAYGTTLEEDEAQLAGLASSADLSTARLRLALEMRCSEKKILLGAISQAAAWQAKEQSATAAQP